MLTFLEQLSDIRQHSYQTQLRLFNKIANRTLNSTQNILALNLQLSKALMNNSAQITQQWLHLKPNAHLCSGEASHLHPEIDQLFDYERELLHIFTNANADLLTFATSEVAEIRDTFTNLAEKEIIAISPQHH